MSATAYECFAIGGGEGVRWTHPELEMDAIYRDREDKKVLKWV